ncbi:ABC transporter substrate-binding protein [Phyllobacterium sp. TAF24]|uniref:ABC transporter substrate-binding protein n=1 Tax=unclassified Phyllobacterium TaxID=2638441 RepID=UPI0008828E71|nr:ABC transporter substrate-binding protein [Phyllobacterium sp. OV277]SDO11185.1 dipeptide transport system substrate-binding protein [Phyllobacterium sp. OV277]
MKTYKKFLAATALAMLTGGLMAGGASAKNLVFCSEAAPGGFDPALYTGGETLDATGQAVFNKLVEFKLGTSEVEPSLAASWTISDDGLEYTFKLRPGVKFQTTSFFTPTRDMNADDVVFSFERQKEGSKWAKYVDGATYEYFESMDFPKLIKEVKKVDDLTVKISLNKPSAPMLAGLAMDFSSIVSKEYADKLQADGTPQKFNEQPVGTGPFQFVDYQLNTAIRYEANPGYFKGKVKVDNLIFAVTTDAAVRVQKIKAGECNITIYPDPADVAGLKADANLKVIQKPGLNIAYLGYNTTQAPFDKPEVRKALNMAIDKKAIVDAVYLGQGTPAVNPIPPTMWSYDKAIKDDEYNPEAAKKALEKAGVKNLSMKIWAMPVARPYMPNGRRTAELLQSDFAKVGVKVEIVSYDWQEYLKRASDPKHDGAVILGWTGDNGDPDNFLAVLLSCQAVGQANRTAWCNKEFTALIDKAAVTADQAERTKLYEQAQVIFKREAPWATLAHSLVTDVTTKNVTGYVQSAFGVHNFADVDITE